MLYVFLIKFNLLLNSGLIFLISGTISGKVSVSLLSEFVDIANAFDDNLVALVSLQSL